MVTMKPVIRLVLLLCVGMTFTQFQGHLYNPHSPQHGTVGTGHFPGGSIGGGPFPGSAPSPSNSDSPPSSGGTNNSPSPATSAPSSLETSGGQTTEYYKAYAGIHCDGGQHNTQNTYHQTDTIQSCFEACDAVTDCVAFAIRDNWSIGGCYMKKNSCLENMNPKPGVTMFVKPISIKMT